MSATVDSHLACCQHYRLPLWTWLILSLNMSNSWMVPYGSRYGRRSFSSKVFGTWPTNSLMASGSLSGRGGSTGPAGTAPPGNASTDNCSILTQNYTKRSHTNNIQTIKKVDDKTKGRVASRGGRGEGSTTRTLTQQTRQGDWWTTKLFTPSPD